MKLATLMDGSRNGQLAVVSRDLTLAHYAVGIAGTLQQLLDDWNFLLPQLEDLSATLNGGKARHAFPFDPQRCLAPLPRPVAWLRASGDVIEAAAGGALAGPQLPLVAETADAPFELLPQLAVITGDLPRGADADQALDGVRLLLLGAEAAQGAADERAWRLHTHAWAAFGPVAVTPDELGTAWQEGRLDARLRLRRAGREWHPIDTVNAAGFGDLIQAASKRRPLAAGTLLAQRLVAAQEGAGAAETPSMKLWLEPGDRVHVDLDTAVADAPLGRLSVSLESLAPSAEAPQS